MQTVEKQFFGCNVPTIVLFWCKLFPWYLGIIYNSRIYVKTSHYGTVFQVLYSLTVVGTTVRLCVPPVVPPDSRPLGSNSHSSSQRASGSYNSGSIMRQDFLHYGTYIKLNFVEENSTATCFVTGIAFLTSYCRSYSYDPYPA